MTVDDERVLMLCALRKGVAPAQLCSVGGVVLRIRLRCQHCFTATHNHAHRDGGVHVSEIACRWAKTAAKTSASNRSER